MDCIQQFKLELISKSRHS